MSLWFQLRVNASTIADVVIQRIHPLSSPAEITVGTPCTYRWTVETSEGWWTGELEQPYGNPWHLVSAVLAALDIQQEDPHAAPERRQHRPR